MRFSTDLSPPEYCHLPPEPIESVRTRIPRLTLKGVSHAQITTHDVTTQDGLGLSLLRFCRKPSKNVVVLHHGLTLSTDMFVMPEHYNLVSFLLDHGFTDVISFDSRMSLRHNYNLGMHRYNMDDVALFDMPACHQRVRELVGEDKHIHVIAHCMGSVGFSMSYVAGLTGPIKSAVLNSVSLTPQVCNWSRLKLMVAPFIFEKLFSFQYLDPNWAATPTFNLGRVLASVFSLIHRECTCPQCNALSVMWGSGFPAVYHHENIHPDTHARLADLFGGTGVNYHRHIRKMCKYEQVISYQPNHSKYQGLPLNYLEHLADITTPLMLLRGQDNRVFFNSNIITHQLLQTKGVHNSILYQIAGYGHQDIFMGRNAAIDCFVPIINFLNQNLEK